MKLIHNKDYDEMSFQASNVLLDIIKHNKNANICLATGGSPAKMYEYFVQAINQDNIDISNITFTKLDEWHGISSDKPFTCETFIQDNLINKLHMQPKQFISFDSNCSDTAQELERVQTLLVKNPIDVMILGLGMNGHLGLNEPSQELNLDCHLASLQEKTKTHDMVNGIKIEHGLTIGLGGIFSSKQVLFLVCGKRKEDAYHSFMSRKITTQIPASLLWLHPDCTAFIDDEQF